MSEEEKQAIKAKGEQEAKEKADAEAKAKVEAETKAQKDAEFEKSIESLSDEEKETKRAEKLKAEEGSVDLDEEDLKEMLKQETERREKAEKKVADDEFKKREAERIKKEKESGQGGDDKPLTKKDLDDVLASERQATQKAANEKEVESYATDMSGSETEKQLIIATFKNRTFPADMPLKQQLEEVYAIVNRKKLINQVAEFKRVLKSKETASKEITTDVKEEVIMGDVKMSSQDAQAIKASGMVWDSVKRVYKKPLGNGKTFLYYDPKSKRRYKGQ